MNVLPIKLSGKIVQLDGYGLAQSTGFQYYIKPLNQAFTHSRPTSSMFPLLIEKNTRKKFLVVQNYPNHQNGIDGIIQFQHLSPFPYSVGKLNNLVLTRKPTTR